MLQEVQRKLGELDTLLEGHAEVDALFAEFTALAEVVNGCEVRYAQLHGDFYLKNILVTPDCKVAVVDFALQQWGPVYFDLAALAAELVEQKLKLGSWGFVMRRQAIMRDMDALLEGYFSGDAFERQVFYFSCSVEILVMWVWYEARYASTRGASRTFWRFFQPFIRRYLRQALRTFLVQPSRKSAHAKSI